MVSADLFFVFFMIIFGFIGTMRGWVREVIVTASLIFGVFVLNQFGSTLDSFVRDTSPDATMGRFLVKAVPFLIFAFFGYLGPAIVRNRFAPSTRGKIEEGILSFIVGFANGFIIFSTLGYLAWKAGILGATPYPPGVNPPTFIAPNGGWENLFFIKNSAVMMFSGTTLIIVLVAIFLFLIIVII
jgi:uncharacterized membrane protein required for colicin V production